VVVKQHKNVTFFLFLRFLIQPTGRSCYPIHMLDDSNDVLLQISISGSININILLHRHKMR
jgi:hypothetical protein